MIPFTRVCSNCNSKNTQILKNGIPNWRKHENKYLCHRCYNRLISNPKLNPRRINFKGKIIYLKENPRTGKCAFCLKSRGDEYVNRFGEIAIIRKTDLHHLEYHDGDPLKDTVELCVSCHMKESRRLKSNEFL